MSTKLEWLNGLPFEEAKADFLGPVWKSRSPGDEERYILVRQ